MPPARSHRQRASDAEISADTLGWSLLVMIFFDEFPDAWAIVGGALIVGAGFYMFRCERLHRAEELGRPDPNAKSGR